VVRPLLVALLLAGLCAVDAEGATRVATKEHLDVGVVQPGKDDGFSHRCPKAAPHPVGTEFYATSGEGDPALDEGNAFGNGRHSWDVGVRGMATEPQPYAAGPICLRAPGRFAYPIKSRVLEPGAFSRYAVTCPRRTPYALNGTLEPNTDADVGQIVMTESVPATTRDGGSTRKWYVGVRNVSTEARSFWVGAVCATPKLKVTHRFTDPISVPPGATDGGSGTCPKRRPFAVAGTFYPADPTGDGQFTFSAVSLSKARRRLTSLVTNRGPTQERVVVGEMCVG
jgi:hypothetical protein